MSTPILVNLGCGAVWHEAWQNYDLQPMSPEISPVDLTRPLPLADESADAVYHAHVLEHLEPNTGAALLGECRRILKPGGLIRIAVPDLETASRLYLAALDGQDELAYDWSVIELLDQMTRRRSEGAMGEFLRTRPWREHPGIRARIGTEVGAAAPTSGAPRQSRKRLANLGHRLRLLLAQRFLNRREGQMLQEARFLATGEVHRWMYDRVSLSRLLLATGFANPIRRTATESALPGFADYALDATAAGQIRHPDSLFMEAVKPA